MRKNNHLKKDFIKSNIRLTQEIAECVGLWLAEGDNKTRREITFTNNCIILVEFFAKTIQRMFKEYNLKPRIYIYSAKKVKIKVNLDCKKKYYNDKRATKPYLIFRIASVDITRQWRLLVKKVINKDEFHNSTLKGFFAGEGNLKEGSHSNKTIRIAQGKPNKLIEKILEYYDITYRYSERGRAYNITGKWNWDRLAQIKIADLHPIKKEKFWRIYNDYKEIHYPDNHIRKNILPLLKKPYTSLELSKIFKRSQARIYDILHILEKEGKIQKFYVESKCYWIKAEQNKIVISKIKNKYLTTLKDNRQTTGELSKEIGVCWKAAYRRLKELQKLNLVEKDSTGNWIILYPKKEVIVL